MIVTLVQDIKNVQACGIKVALKCSKSETFENRIETSKIS